MTRRALALSVGACCVAAYQFVLRRHFETHGASPDEVAASYPGDDLVPGGRRGATMATTIAAPPSEVWPWLVQMGFDRGGWYSWDRLDNGGHPSANRIHPRWQQLTEGDRLASSADGTHGFDVALVEPERTLVLRASMTVPGAKQFDPSGELPRVYVDSTWGFHLRPTSAGGTRLLTTGWARASPRWLTELGNWLFWGPAHWIMQTRQFHGLQRRAEGL
jgi:proline iminopeptidase